LKFIFFLIQNSRLFKVFYTEGKADQYVKQIFQVFDSDNSGKIDFIEFVAALSTTSHGDIKQKLRLAFRMIDRNNNGLISKSELEKIITAIYDLRGERNRTGESSPKQRAIAIMKKLDIDGSGSLDINEFVEGCMNDPFMSKLVLV
jgi:Ca2+-binding EF-hand superfamily protein